MQHHSTSHYLLIILIAFLDLTIVIGSGVVAYYLRNDVNISLEYQAIILINGLVILLSSSFCNLYHSWRGLSFINQLYKVFGVWLFSFACVLALLFFSKQGHYFSRVWFATWLSLGVSLTCFYKTIVFLILKKARKLGKNVKKIVIVGKGKIVDNIINASEKYSEYGFKATQVIDLSKADFNEELLDECVDKTDCQEIWICLPLSESSIVKKILYALRYSTAEIRFFPEMDDMSLLNHKITNLMGFHSIDLSCTSIDGMNNIIKRTEDIILSAIILVIIFIPCLFIAIIIKLTSAGPILFKQLRHGLGKKEVKVYKFRTMTVHQEQRNLVIQATKNDTRITPFGAFLRRTSLDEFPQFINVLQGRMSIVGPRPHALAHNEYYKDLVESYMWRHKVKPGITGWAQINGFRGETDTLDKMQKRVEYDLWYIENWSLYLDLKIILLTIFKGFIHKNAY